MYDECPSYDGLASYDGHPSLTSYHMMGKTQLTKRQDSVIFIQKMVELHHKSRNQLINETFTFRGFFNMSGILFLVRKFCNVEIMPMVVVGRWRHKGGPHEPHPIFIFQTIFISKLINNDKKGNLGNQWQSLISSLRQKR